MNEKQRQSKAMIELLKMYEIPLTAIFYGNTSRVSQGRAGITINNLEKVVEEYNKKYLDHPTSIDKVLYSYGVILNDLS